MMTIEEAELNMRDIEKNLAKGKKADYIRHLISCYKDTGITAIYNEDDPKILLFYTNAQLGFLQKIWKETKANANARQMAIYMIHDTNKYLSEVEKEYLHKKYQKTAFTGEKAV